MEATMETMPLTYGQRFDAIGDRMDAAYAERRKCEPGTAEYESANEAIEAVYADLRVLNAEMRAARP
jgi:hypothetical protein